MTADLLPADTAGEADGRRLCVFTLGNLRLGVDVRLVQEVTERLPLTAVPMAPAGVRGVVNLRGHLVTALDLPALIALPPAPDDAPVAAVDLILRHGGELVGLPVDHVAEVVHAPVAAGSPPPRNLTGPVRDLVSAVYRLEDGLLLELDVPALVAAARSGAPRTTPRKLPS